MRDPMTWAIPLYRAFGITVRLHLFFLLITVPLCLRQVNKYDWIAWYDIVGLWVGVLFGIILLHEYGHCFAARWVGGTADEILLWPLGGLAFCSPPHQWRANFITAAGGPAVNLAICAASAGLLAVGGFLPPVNPISDPFAAQMRNYRDGRTYTSVYGENVYKTGTADKVGLPPGVKTGKTVAVPEVQVELARTGVEWAVAPGWAVWVWRVCWLSWVNFLFNMLIPAFPMDCGRLIRDALWGRSGDYRQSTITACYVGYVSAAVMFAVALYLEEVMLSGLSFFIVITCYQTLMAEVNADAGAFGYDFSAGYTSLEKDDPPPPRPKKLGPIKGWLAARRARKIAREAQEKARDEERMDQLLDKIAKSGKKALSDEEQRFMERVSARYRNRS